MTEPDTEAMVRAHLAADERFAELDGWSRAVVEEVLIGVFAGMGPIVKRLAEDLRTARRERDWARAELATLNADMRSWAGPS